MSFRPLLILLITLLNAATIVKGAAAVKVACIGNSITAGGYGWLDGTTYPRQLQQLLGPGYQVQNDGVPGTTVCRNGDYPYWEYGQLPQVFALNPDIVTIKLGTNDGKPQNWACQSEFARDLGALIDTLRTLPSRPRIFLVLPAPVFPPGCCSIDPGTLNQEIVPLVRQVANTRSLPLIDCHTPLLSFPEYFPDGVHPTAAGADTIAHIIFRAISSPNRVTIPPLLPLSPPFEVHTQGNGSLALFLLSSGLYNIDLLTIAAKTMRSFSTAGPVKLDLQTPTLPCGVYLLRVRPFHGSPSFMKVVVWH